jgi:hypothetical protein
MTEFIENTFKAKKEFENWSIDLAGLARYLNEDDAVIELAGKYTLSLNLIDMVEKSTWTYSLDSNVSDYLAEHDEDNEIMFEFIEEDAHEASRIVRDIQIHEDFEEFKKTGGSDNDFDADDEEIKQVLSGNLQLDEVSYYDEFHELYDTYSLHHTYTHMAVEACIKAILEIKHEVEYTVRRTKELLCF